MAKFRVMIGRLAASGNLRVEVSNWLVEVALVSARDPRIEDVDHVPIARVPTPVARNVLVKTAHQRGVDILFMVDDDMGPPEGFWKTALDFLLAHQGPAVIGVPYCTAPPREDVLVFEWASGQSDTPETPWAVVNIVREDAARRKGIEAVANIGTGVIAYKMSCFDAVPAPYYDYSYNDDHTDVVETEDCYLHRRLHFAGVPLYVSWDHWAYHYKTKRVGKPVPITRDHIAHAFALDAEAGRKQVQGNGRQPGKDVLVIERPPLEHGRYFPYPISAGEVRERSYAAQAVQVLARPAIEVGKDPMNPEAAARWATSVPGWMTDDELHWLARWAINLQAGDTWVEVGCWKGRSLSAVTLAMPIGGVVVAVDTWRGSPDELKTTHAEAAEGDTVFHDFLGTVGQLNVIREHAVSIAVHRDPSARVALSWPRSEPIAVVFIDGAHDAASVRMDLECWTPRVQPGGLICGHDRNAPGVALALTEWSEAYDHKLEQGPGSLWFVRLPEAPT